ncbi:fungal-specific transcription factor domain-containing protein [Mycena rosella]|uniref:Fungal-specific transcription factor domain-containing protein n=1 Tax=Mycena rosella TaxID=1033263 RepID=A0AAD7CWM8_MYCRO|nr:fungal-specific transcription factor domain-containing protein [Mycena rosella]
MDKATPATGSNASPTPGSAASSSAARKSQITSCAECRRLKLRCDRVFPCSSCIRRGCANLCPNGTLEKGKRGFLKRLEQSLPSSYPKAGGEIEHGEVAMFVARDSAMMKRIQELEAALTGAGITIPGPTHVTAAESSQDNEGRAKRPRTSSFPDPVASGSNSRMEKDSSSSAAPDATDVTLGFGTLTIDVENRSRYVGPSGGAAYLNADLWKMNTSQTLSRRNSQDNVTSSFDSSVARGQNSSIGSGSLSVSQSKAEILAKMGCVPPHREAVRIACLYFKNVSFMYEIIPEEIFFKSHLPAVYPDTAGAYVPTNLHVLSLFAMVLSLGAFFDLSVPSSDVRNRAAEFYDLAVAALNISIPLKLDTIPAVQTLHLMALYFLSTRGESGGDPAWQVLGMAMRSIQAQGCHRDGSRWGLPQRELEERRRVFWETHTYDRLQSFTFGRPYAQSDSHHDCEMPQTCDTPLPSDTDISNSTFSHMRWHYHKFQFALLLGRIVDLVFSAKHPQYSVIMQVDREINEHYDSLPAWILCDAVKNPANELPAHALAGDSELKRDAQIASLANMYFLTLLHLHRGPFCRALMLGPKNLTNCRYSTSVASLTNAARAIINIARGLFALHPALTSRMWYWIFHSFTAAVCQAVLVIVAPSHPLSPAAFESMQAAVELFERADGERAKSAAIRVGWLAARASQAMDAYRNSTLHKPLSTRNRASTASPAPQKLQFPTSNIRGNPEDLLGTSTKLIRAQHGDAPSAPSSMSTVPSRHQPAAMPASGFQFTSSDPRYMRAANQDHWPPSLSLPPASTSRNGMDWGPDFTQNSLPSTTAIHHLGNDPQLQFQQAPFLDPSLYLSVDGFDLSGFIQNGANAWLFDRAPDIDSEELLSQPVWPERMQ